GGTPAGEPVDHRAARARGHQDQGQGGGGERDRDRDQVPGPPGQEPAEPGHQGRSAQRNHDRGGNHGRGRHGEVHAGQSLVARRASGSSVPARLCTCTTSASSRAVTAAPTTTSVSASACMTASTAGPGWPGRLTNTGAWPPVRYPISSSRTSAASRPSSPMVTYPKAPTPSEASSSGSGWNRSTVA